MPPVTAFMVIAPCVLVMSAPAVLCHALLRNYWLACLTIWALALACGFGVAQVWNFPVDHFVFGFIASFIGLATGMLVGVPFVLYRRGWLAHWWARPTDRDLPPGERDIRSKVARLKDDHRRWRQRIAAMRVLWFLAAFVTGLATWLAQEPANRDPAMFSGVAALMIAILVAGTLLTRVLFPKPQIKCPQCGQQWQRSDSKDSWLNWKCCPECGLQIRGEVDRRR